MDSTHTNSKTSPGQAAIGSPRRLSSHTDPDQHNWSAGRINALRSTFPHMFRYLEIGVEYGLTLEQVDFPSRVGVDPQPRFALDAVPDGMTIHPVTSDEFFADLDPSAKFDVVFVDGLHTYQQTYRDVINALRVCPRGMLLIDDVVPSDEVSAIPHMDDSFAERTRRGLEGLPWHGDVYKTILVLADHHPELDLATIVDRGNPQTWVWRRHRWSNIAPVSDAMLESYRSKSYSDVFANGIPRSFRPVRESEALDLVIEGLHRLRGRSSRRTVRT